MARALFSTPRAGCSLHKHDHMLQGPSPGEVPGSAPCLSRDGTGPGDAQPAAGTGGHSPTPARAQPDPRQGTARPQRGHSPTPGRAQPDPRQGGQPRSPQAKLAALSGLQQPAAHPRGQHGQAPGVRTATPRYPAPQQDTYSLPGATPALTAGAAPRILPGPAELQ